MTEGIMNDWIDSFPDFKIYSPNKLYKINGLIVLGIELIKIPKTDEYRPHFVIYPLWGNNNGKDLKACLSKPILMKEFLNKKGSQISLTKSSHKSQLPDVVKIVREQLPVSLDGDISLERTLDAFHNYSKTPPLSAAPNSYLQALLKESELELVICVGNNEKATKIVENIHNKNWDNEHFK